MRRQWFGLLLAGLLTLPGAAEGQSQCRKRILVFLDVSGTMRPLVRTSASPFQQSLDAVEALLGQQGFIEAEDVVEVVRFGKDVEARNEAKGGERIAELLRALRANDRTSNETDFRALFGALSETLQKSSPYNSQVVLLASDLVHEHRNGRPNDELLQDWASVLSETATTRAEILASSGKTAYVLFVPPSPAGRSIVQERVWGDLQQQQLPRLQRVAPGQGAQAELAAELRRGLLSPPRLTLSRDSDDRLAFIVSNPNCYPLRLERLTVRRVASDGSTSDPVSFPVGDNEALLEGIGTDTATRTLTRTMPSGFGWSDAEALKGTVETQEGLLGESDGTARSWLRYAPERGVVEGYLLRAPALRLDLRVLGHTLPEEAKTYRLSVRSGEGEEAEVFAEGRFSAPRNLDAIEPRTMRVVLPASRAQARALTAGKSYRVVVEGAETLEGQADGVEILLDPVANRSNLFVLVAGVVGLAAVIVSFFLVFGIVRSYPALRQGKSLVLWMVALGLALVPLVMNLAHISLLRHLSPRSVDWLALAASIPAVFFCIALGLERALATLFGQRVLSGSPLELRSYRRLSRSGAWAPWVAAVLALGLFGLSWYLGHPAVSERFARDVDPPQLRVVSD